MSCSEYTTNWAIFFQFHIVQKYLCINRDFTKIWTVFFSWISASQNCIIVRGRHWSTWPTWILNTWRIWCYSVLHMNVWSVKMTLKGGALPCFSQNCLGKNQRTGGMIYSAPFWFVKFCVWSKRWFWWHLFFTCTKKQKRILQVSNSLSGYPLLKQNQ